MASLDHPASMSSNPDILGHTEQYCSMSDRQFLQAQKSNYKSKGVLEAETVSLIDVLHVGDTLN